MFSMRIRSIILACIILFLLCLSRQPLCFALNWKTLHEKANNISLLQAIAQENESPECIDNIYILAIAYFNKHDDEQAREKFLRILEKDPFLIEAKWGIAEFQRRKYKYDIAADLLKKIMQENPDFSPAYISLAYIKYMQSDFQEVVRLMGIVINQGIKNTDLTTYVRAHCLYAGGKGMIAYLGGPVSKIVNGPAVFRHLKIAQELKPDSVAVYFGFGCYYLLRTAGSEQDLEKAEKYLKQALKIDPLFADGYVRLSQVYSFKENSKMAKIFLDKALVIDPDNLLAADIISKECKFICK